MARFECRTGVRHVIQAGAEPGPSPLQRVGTRRELTILAGSQDPRIDADVILTAAVVGHTIERLKQGKACEYDFEPGVTKEDTAKDHDAHLKAISLINQAVADAGVSGSATLGMTPAWKKGGRITGGTGDLAPGPDRYNPPPPTGMSKQLFDLATGAEVVVSPATSSQPARRETVDHLLGYQGRGAYTGFIDGRPDGQTGLMSTFRFRAAGPGPTVPDWGVRWLPEDPSKAGGAPIGMRDQQRIWGMIGDHALQVNLGFQGMYFQDSDAARGGTGLKETDVVGYVHGMIQAIYDVAWRRSGHEQVTPFEIAVGAKTTKLASCLPCSLFMEATGFPASSTHLGRGESWCVLHPTAQDEQPTNRSPGRLSRGEALKACNDQWAAYCRRILTSGSRAIERSLTDDHLLSFDALQAMLQLFEGHKASDYFWANLILDACTIHDSECKRIGRTLKRRNPPPPDTAQVNQQRSPSQTAEPCPLRSLTVEVVLASGDTKSPPATARVSATGPENRPAQTASVQRGAGKVTFAKLKPGRYEVTVGPPDDPTEAEKHTGRFQRTEPRVVTLDQDDVSITVRLFEWDAIEFMFVGSDGKPIANHPYRFEPPAGTPPAPNAAPPATNGAGIGRHEGLAVGFSFVEVADGRPAWTSHSEATLARRRT